MQCLQCATEVSELSKFCTQCGTPIEEPKVATDGQTPPSRKYNIAFTGEIGEGFLLDDVKSNLVKKLRMRPEQVERLFSNKNLNIKKNVGKEEAERIVEAFKNCGVVCKVQQISLSSSESSIENNSVFPPSQAADSEDNADDKDDFHGINLAQVAQFGVVFPFILMWIFSNSPFLITISLISCLVIVVALSILLSKQMNKVVAVLASFTITLLAVPLFHGLVIEKDRTAIASQTTTSTSVAPKTVSSSGESCRNDYTFSAFSCVSQAYPFGSKPYEVITRLMQNGSYSMRTSKEGNQCYADIDASGSLRGYSYNYSFRCKMERK